MQSDKKRFKKTGLVYGVVMLMVCATNSFSQENVSLEKPFNVSGAFNLTSQGISTIPSYSLGKPAMIYSMSMGNKFTFEPEFRFSLKGEPWMYILWLKYNFSYRDKFKMKIGINPSIFFRDITSVIPDGNTEAQLAQRSLTTDIYPSYQLTNNISTGLYYMYIRGLVSFAPKNTHYLAFKVNFNDINIFEKFHLSINPQVYYLRVYPEDGYYFSSTLALRRQGFPLSLHSLISKEIKSSITGASSFLWNISLTYSFAYKFNRKTE